MGNLTQNSRVIEVSFSASTELCGDLTIQNGNLTCLGQAHLPGQPLVSLEDSEVLEYLEKELVTPKLNKMAPHLWLLTTPSSANISALHDQIVRGRNITISENPELHLVWIDSRVFIKPLPVYLLSRAFWEYYLKSTDARQYVLAQAALGYLRTYFYLVRHESDYRLAIEHHLIPADVTYPKFMAFVASFKDILDDHVSPRYHFGELRLSRLNFWSLPLLGKHHFHKVAWQYSEIFARYYAPYLFIFSIFSVVLSAMQVGLGARSEWVTFRSVSAWFSVVTLVCTTIAGLFLSMALIFLTGREIVYSLNLRLFKRRTVHP